MAAALHGAPGAASDGSGFRGAPAMLPMRLRRRLGAAKLFGPAQAPSPRVTWVTPLPGAAG